MGHGARVGRVGQRRVEHEVQVRPRPRWAWSVTATTTPCVRASLPRSSASSSINTASGLRPRRRWRCSTTSRASTTRTGVTPPSARNHRSTSSDFILRPRKTPRDTASTLPLSPRYAGKRSSPQPGRAMKNPSAYPSTEAGQLQPPEVLGLGSAAAEQLLRLSPGKPHLGHCCTGVE